MLVPGDLEDPVQMRGGMNTEQTVALTQQIVSYAALIGIEGFWAVWRMPAQPGKAGLFPTIAGIASLLAVTAAVQQEAQQVPAEIAGLLVSGAPL